MRWIKRRSCGRRSVQGMDNLDPILAALALFGLYAVLVWIVARGWPSMFEEVKNCAACALRPVCDTGAVVDCPNVRRSRRAP